MTREERVERVWQLLVEPRETDAPLSLLATRIVDALAQPVERHFTDEQYDAKCNELVDTVMELVDLRKAAREVLAMHDDWYAVVQGERNVVEAHQRERAAWDALRAALG